MEMVYFNYRANQRKRGGGMNTDIIKINDDVVDAIFEEPDCDYAKYRAQCMIEAVRVGIFGLLDKSQTGATLSEFEVVGLSEILGMASDIVAGIKA
jgi:hypothetical protein